MAALLAGGSLAAQAQSSDAPADTHWRFGIQAGNVQDHQRSEPSARVSLGYDIDRTWTVEALIELGLAFERDGGLADGERLFDDAAGVRVLATLPLGERWNLVGGLGIVRAEYDVGYQSPQLLDFYRHSVRQTTPMVSLAAMYKLGRRWSLGLEASSFTRESTFNLGLRGEFHF